MKIQTILNFLANIAPPAYQESYDNAGLIVGNAQNEVTGVLCALDCTEAILAEAEQRNCNLVVAHHPIVFRGLKSLTGKNYVERVVMEAIRKDISIYAIHTNLDNVYFNGVNSRIGQRLGLENTSILVPKKGLCKLVVDLPAQQVDELKQRLLAKLPGAMRLEQQRLFASIGVQRTVENINAVQQISLIVPEVLQGTYRALIMDKYPSAVGSLHFIPVQGKNLAVGSGLIGDLPASMTENAFLGFLKDRMKTSVIRHTALLGRKIKTVALCGGAGSFLLPHAIRQKADIYITGDYKYHEFFDADGQIVIADIGHYESEQFTIDLLAELLSDNFSNFAAHCTKRNTNPVRYYLD